MILHGPRNISVSFASDPGIKAALRKNYTGKKQRLTERESTSDFDCGKPRHDPVHHGT